MLLIANAFHSVAQVQKRPMTHDDYALWNAITAQKITNDASFVMYELTPQRGDSRVIIATADALGSDTIYCASQSAFTYDGAYAIARVKAPFASTRQMKIDKKKDDDMPKDTLVVKKLGSKDVKKYAPLSSVEKGKKASWFAFLLDKEKFKVRFNYNLYQNMITDFK